MTKVRHRGHTSAMECLNCQQVRYAVQLPKQRSEYFLFAVHHESTTRWRTLYANVGQEPNIFSRLHKLHKSVTATRLAVVSDNGFD